MQSLVNKEEDSSFFINAFALSGSVTPLVFWNVIYFTVFSILVSVAWHWYPNIALPIAPFEYAGLVMGLILVFRVNAGYDRWWEARKIWGNVVNHSRNLAIIVKNYVKTADNKAMESTFNLVAAMPFIMKNHLRGQDNLDEIGDLVTPGELTILEQATHRPSQLSSFLAARLFGFMEQNQLDSFSYMQAEEKRALIIDAQGACERILKTPIPYVMAIKSRRFICLFLLAMPFALVSLSPYINPLITGLVAYALLALDQIGVELQSPFSQKRLSHLPLNDICNTIKNNVMEIKRCQSLR